MKATLAVLAVAGLTGAVSAQLSAVSNIPGTWMDISSPANNTGLYGDDSTIGFVATHGNAIMPAGAGFISTNGVFTSNDFPNYSNAPLPDGIVSGYAPFWDDQINDPGAGSTGDIFAVNLADRTIIQWNNIQGFFNTGPMTYQLQIFDGPTGPGGALAQFLYLSVSQSGSHANGASATIGAVQDAANFAQFSYNTASIQDGSVVSIVPAPGSLALLGLGGLMAGRRRRR